MHIIERKIITQIASLFQSIHQRLTLRNLKAFPTTETELKLMANAAIMGLREAPRRDKARPPQWESRSNLNEGEEQVLLDVRHGCPAENPGAARCRWGSPFRVTPPHSRRRPSVPIAMPTWAEGRSMVSAILRMATKAPSPLKLFHLFAFILGRTYCDHLFDPEPARHGLGCAAAVAREHDHRIPS